MKSKARTRPPPSSEEADLRAFLERLCRGAPLIHVPPETGAHRRRERGHFHASAELLIQIGGATDFDCPGARFRMNSGDACVVPRGVPHAETPVDTTSPYGVLVCMYSPDGMYLHRGKKDANGRIQGYGTHLLRSPLGRDAFRHLDELAHHNRLAPQNQAPYARALMEAFLLIALSLFHNEQPKEEKTAPRPPAVRAAEQCVASRLGDPELSVRSIAAAVPCSADHLSRQFRQHHGVSLQTWLLQRRIEYACELLSEGRFNITEVGWACGFSDPSYFVRVFRQQRGITPRKYRMNAG